MKRFLYILPVVLCIVWTQWVSAAEDVEPPTLMTFSVLPKIIDTESSNASVTVLFNVTDNLSGLCLESDNDCIKKTRVTVNSPYDQDFEANISRIAGNGFDGSYKAIFDIPRYAAAGDCDVEWGLYDKVGNLVWYYDGENDDEPQVAALFASNEDVFTNNTTVEDVLSPVVVGTPTVTPTSINTQNSFVDVVVEFSATDNMSGVCLLDSCNTDVNIEGYEGVVERVSGDDLDGDYRAVVRIPQYAKIGNEYDMEIDLIDMVDNENELEYSHILNNTATVEDAAKPEFISSPTGAPSIISTSGGKQIIKVRLNVSDDLSGICVLEDMNCVAPVVRLKNTTSVYEARAHQVTGGSNVVLEADIVLPRYARLGWYTLQYYIEDAVGNSLRTDNAQESIYITLNKSATPIYRLYNKKTGTQLYTRGQVDRDKILNKYPDFEFTDRTPAFYASTSNDGNTPMYRLYNTRTGAQLYTKGEADRDKILNKWHDFEFTDGGPAFYAAMSPAVGLTPIFRLYNTRTGMHLYTKGIADREKILNKYSDFEFTDGVPAFYASTS